jgi:hypothetical protein
MSVAATQLARLISAYPSANVDEEMLGVWTKKMGSFPPAIMTRTVDTLIENCKFFPSVAEFVSFAGSESAKQRAVQHSQTRRDCAKCDEGWKLEDVVCRLESNYPNRIVMEARPCPVCLPDTYTKWKAGEYEMRRN